MNIENLNAEIESDRLGSWFIGPGESIVFRGDVNFRLVRNEKEVGDQEIAQIFKRWADNRFPDSTIHQVGYSLLYGSTEIDEVNLFLLDGTRRTSPIPLLLEGEKDFENGCTARWKDYCYARIIAKAHDEDFEETIRRCNIVAPEQGDLI